MYREGAQIAWLTNDPDAQLWGEKIHGRVFRQRISRGSCGQILDGGAVDCAVLLTAPWRELASGGASRGSLLEMLDAVLEEAAATGTRKVCLLSSEMLAEEEPLDAGLEELRAAERLAEAFCRQHCKSSAGVSCRQTCGGDGGGRPGPLSLCTRFPAGSAECL